MGFEIVFKIGGHTVGPEQFWNVLEKAPLEMLQERIRDSVGPMRCANHGTAPRIVVSSGPVNQLGMRVAEACCEEFKSAVEARLEENVL